MQWLQTLLDGIAYDTIRYRWVAISVISRS